MQEHDGAVVIIKWALTTKQLDANGAKLQNIHDVVEWKMWNDGKNRVYKEVHANDVDRNKAYGCRIVKGTRKTYYMLGFSRKDTSQLLFHSLSCFCSMCIDENWDKCLILSIVESWRLHKLDIERQHENEDLEQFDNIVYYDLCWRLWTMS